MHNLILACIFCTATATAFAQPLPAWNQPVPGRGIPTYRSDPAERLLPLLQLDATVLLEPPPPAEPPPRQRPMFSNGWTRGGFGGQPREWR